MSHLARYISINVGPQDLCASVLVHQMAAESHLCCVTRNQCHILTVLQQLSLKHHFAPAIYITTVCRLQGSGRNENGLLKKRNKALIFC